MKGKGRLIYKPCASGKRDRIDNASKVAVSRATSQTTHNSLPPTTELQTAAKGRARRKGQKQRENGKSKSTTKDNLAVMNKSRPPNSSATNQPRVPVHHKLPVARTSATSTPDYCTGEPLPVKSQKEQASDPTFPQTDQAEPTPRRQATSLTQHAPMKSRRDDQDLTSNPVFPFPVPPGATGLAPDRSISGEGRVKSLVVQSSGGVVVISS